MGLHALKTGHMLSEYKIIKLLGEGGFGLTYLAMDTLLDKKVAVKEYMPCEHAIRKSNSHIVAKSVASKTVYNWGLNAFLNEAKILAKFEDSNIVRVFRFFKANGTAYIVMEYCEGGCLIDRIDKNKKMDEEDLKEIISSIIHGLQLVHNDGILHRDIKPDNIMFRQNGTPVLIDFGAARQAIGVKSRKVTTIITPGFAPLEQYSTKGVIGPWSDIYSLSAVAYMCLTGKRPPDIMNRLHEDNIKKLGSSFPSSAFLKSIDKGLNLQVDDRPKSLSEWSSKWSNYSIPVSTEFALNNEVAPEIEKELEKQKRKKENKQHQDQPTVVNPQDIKTEQPFTASRNNETSAQRPERMPISARTSLLPNEPTVFNIDAQDYHHRNISTEVIDNNGSKKVLITFAILTVLGLLGFFGYKYFEKQQESDLRTVQLQEKKEQEQDQLVEQRKQLIIKVQKELNKLGFTVPENGIIDQRTKESIKSFERQNELVITGSVDQIVLDELNNAYKIIDDQAWEKASKRNSQASYQEYLYSHPNGSYSSQVPIIMQELENKYNKGKGKKSKTNKKRKKFNRLEQITAEKRKMVAGIQSELKRLKYLTLTVNGKLDQQTKSAIYAYQKSKKYEQTGLPTKTLLYQLKSENKWPGRRKGERFQDCNSCPNMIVISSGNFIMGSTKGKDNELPKHNVRVDEFVISQAEITFKQWDACYEDGFCSHRPDDDNFGRGNMAVMNVNWYDIQQFLKWLSNKSNKQYRLPTEAEWEYAARAGTTTEFFWGNSIGTNHANCKDCNTSIDTNKNQIRSFAPNKYGLYDMHGNVWEWTQDCWHPNYNDAPSAGVAWEPVGCSDFVVRGGSSGNFSVDLRSASRGVMQASKRLNTLGFRVALDSL